MTQVIYVPGFDTLVGLHNGDVQAFLMGDDRRDDLDDIIRLKPSPGHLDEDSIRRLVRHDIVPMYARVRFRLLTSIFALSTSQLRMLDEPDRVECLKNATEIIPELDMKSPVTFFALELID